MNILMRVKGIIMSPDAEWDGVKAEKQTDGQIYLSYVVPLASLGSISLIVGHLSRNMDSISYAVTAGVQDLLIRVLTIFIASYVIYFLAEIFSSKKDINAATKLVAYSSTPGLIAAVVANFSIYLSWVGLFGLYGIYLFWMGLSKMLDTPSDKKLIYCIVAAIIQIGLAVALTSLLVLTRFL